MSGSVGIPLNAVSAFGFHMAINSRVVAKIRCGDTNEFEDDLPEIELSQCSISISTASTESIAGVRCFERGE